MFVTVCVFFKPEVGAAGGGWGWWGGSIPSNGHDGLKGSRKEASFSETSVAETLALRCPKSDPIFIGADSPFI